MANKTVKPTLDLEKAKTLIKEWEKLRLEAYKDAVGIWTIGYGCTRYNVTQLVLNEPPRVRHSLGREVIQGDIITEDQADAELLHHVLETSQRVYDLCYPMVHNENQHNALVSLVFNIGIGNFRDSTLLKLIHNKANGLKSDEFLKWNKGRVNGKLVVLNGLMKRREQERELFMSEI